MCSRWFFRGNTALAETLDWHRRVDFLLYQPLNLGLVYQSLITVASDSQSF